MTRVIVFANQKGGVGKTTTCVNLGASLVIAKRRVLIVDCDPQGNATMGSGVDKSSCELSMNEVLLGEVEITEAVIKDVAAGYHIVAGNEHLTQAEVFLLSQPNRERKLFFVLENICEQYDYILIDSPPSLNMLTVNALVAADGIIIPMQCEYYALEGLSALVKTINSVRRTANPRLQIDGLLRTMYDHRNRLAQDVSAQLIEHFGDKVLNTVIPRNVRLAEAPSHGMPIIQYDKHSKGASAYLALAGELLKRYRTQNALTNVTHV